MTEPKEAWKKNDLKVVEKVLPPDFTKGRKFYKFQMWTPSLWDRIKILIGFRVIVGAQFISQHSPGTVAAGVFAQTSAISAGEFAKIPDDQLLKSLVTLNEKKTVNGVDFDKVEQLNPNILK